MLRRSGVVSQWEIHCVSRTCRSGCRLRHSVSWRRYRAVFSQPMECGSTPLTDEDAAYVPAAQITDAPFLALAHTFPQPSCIVRVESPEGLTGLMQRALAAH